jgi:hypothetical protein
MRQPPDEYLMLFFSWLICVAQRLSPDGGDEVRRPVHAGKQRVTGFCI